MRASDGPACQARHFRGAQRNPLTQFYDSMKDGRAMLRRRSRLTFPSAVRRCAINSHRNVFDAGCHRTGRSANRRSGVRAIAAARREPARCARAPRRARDRRRKHALCRESRASSPCAAGQRIRSQASAAHGACVHVAKRWCSPWKNQLRAVHARPRHRIAKVIEMRGGWHALRIHARRYARVRQRSRRKKLPQPAARPKSARGEGVA